MPHEQKINDKKKKDKNFQVLHGEWWGATTRGKNELVIEELAKKKRLGPASREEVIPLIRKYVKSGSTVMTDGLKAYRVIPNEPKRLGHGYVRHGKYEFMRVVEIQGVKMLAGTQKIDGAWGNMKMWLGARRGVAHRFLPEYVREFQWRYVLADKKDGFFALGKVIRGLVEKKKLVL